MKLNLEELMGVSSIINTSSDISGSTQHREMFKKSQQRESTVDFGSIFKTACDELKQNQAAHTKARVLTLN